MAWLRKKPDPISERAQMLTAEIALLESEIQKLDAQLQTETPPPRLRSTALPSTANRPAPGAAPASTPEEPIFEQVGAGRFESPPEHLTTPEHYNALGVRKYDLPALFRRLQNHFRGPSTTNPKLVSYLAAGGIQGLRPLRYEKRVARNRFIVFVVFLFLALLGLVTIFFRHR
jgi:cell division protein FtsB